ncbi:hypothetical protein niasHT_000345 [Heterodera trifolii]|uniref:Galectin domain-containing protein n=1 Tax=Heterodera trifolii TaxID=157864 RepID=A0ABD2MC73_9BILA
MLICYPGALDAEQSKFSFGMVPEKQFRVQNIAGNDVATKCAEMHHGVCKQSHDKKGKKMEGKHCKHGANWHGIRLSKPKDAENKMHLEMSFINKTYKFELSHLEFVFEFGNKQNLVTVLKDRNGNVINFLNDDENAIGKAYMARKTDNAILLSNYLGFWMLGLDILPMLNRETMHLHAFRDCGCEMHGWFLHPTENPEKASKASFADALPRIPKNCQTSANNSQLTIDGTPEIGKMLRVQFRISEEPKELSVRLLNKKGEFVMEIAMTENGTRFRPDDLDMPNLPKRVSNKTLLQRYVNKYMQFDFVLYAYFYEVRVNRRKYVHFFPWHANWWMHESETVDIATVELNGSLFPESGTAEIIEETSEQYRDEKSFLNLGMPLLAGESVVIRGQIDQNAKSVHFYLLHNTFDKNKYIGNVVLEFIIKFLADDRNEDNGENSDNLLDSPFKKALLRPGEPFELRLLLRSENEGNSFNKIATSSKVEVTLFTLRANSEVFKHVLQNNKIDNIRVKGDVTLFTTPKIKREPLHIKELNYRVRVANPPLAAGDSMIFEGKLKKNATYLSIFFLHNTLEPKNNENEIPFKIHFEFSEIHEENLMWLSSNLTKWGFPKLNDSEKENSRIFAGQEFKIEITVKEDKFELYIHGAYVINYAHRVPPWVTNLVRIEGDFKGEPRISRKRGPAVITDLSKLDSANANISLPIVLAFPVQLHFGNGDLLIIRGVVAKAKSDKNLTISVILLNGALETYRTVHSSIEHDKKVKKIGRVILDMQFSARELKCSERFNDYDLKEKDSYPLKRPIKPGKSFNLNIYFHNESDYSVRLNNIVLFNRTFTLPHWAIQYIRIDGDLVTGNTTISIESQTKNAEKKRVKQ